MTKPELLKRLEAMVDQMKSDRSLGKFRLPSATVSRTTCARKRQKN